MSIDVHELRSRAEAEHVLDVNAAAWRAAYDFLPERVLPPDDYVPDPDRIDEFHAAVQDREAPLFVASVDRELQGFAELRWGRDQTEGFVASDDAELKALYVHPDSWRRGVGSALLEASRFVVPPTYRRLALQTFEANVDARRFYEERDFARVGESTFDIGDDEFPTVVYALAND